MKTTFLFLLMATALPAEQETVLKATRSAHMLVLTDVHLNGSGPFRMMVDTGDASSMIRPAIAQRIGLRPAYRVEQVTPSGSRLVPAGVLNVVRVGAVSDKGVEAMIADVRLPEVDGVLGQSWLMRHDYLLDYRGRRLVLDGSPPEHGMRVALRCVDGRLLIPVDLDGIRSEVALDSGAPAVVIFARSHSTPATMLLTNAGATPAESGTVRVSVQENRRRTMPVVRISCPETTPALFPTCLFSAVYVSSRTRYVIFLP